MKKLYNSVVSLLRVTVLMFVIQILSIDLAMAQDWAEVGKTYPDTYPEFYEGGQFGYYVAIDGDYMVIGEPKGENIDGYSNGAVSVYYHDGSNWLFQGKLYSDISYYDELFGRSIAISGDVIVVGDYERDEYDGADEAGTVFVYEKPEGGWTDMMPTAKLNASDKADGDRFGYDVAISDDVIVVGAPYNDGAADDQSTIGSAYVFEKPDGGWADMSETASLAASDGVANDRFGISVAIEGDIIVVGSTGDDDNGSSSGSAYVFEKPDGEWDDTNEIAKLTAADGEASDSFGRSVSISNNVIVVGANGDDGSIGSAYVFEQPDGGWTNMTHTAKLTRASRSQEDYFGSVVDISGNVVIVGVSQDLDSNPRGAAYVFEKSGDGWIDMTETMELTAEDGEGGDALGRAVAISEEMVVVGAPFDDNDGTDDGSAYVFEQPSDGWGNLDLNNYTKLLPESYNNVSRYAYYGRAVAMDGDYAVVGAYGETGYGAAYVLAFTGNRWERVARLTASDGAEGDEFGYSVAISGDIVVIGAYLDDEEEVDIGSAYIFEKPADGWADMTETAKLTASDGVESSILGRSVSISNDVIVVGAYSDSENGEIGLAYVFEQPDGGWVNMTETAKLTASDEGGGFAVDVSIFRDVIVVGANSAYNDEGIQSGAAYVYQRSEDGWTNMTETAKLTKENGADNDKFGQSVSIDEDVIVVGAYFDYNDESRGSVYVFERPDDGWTDMTQTAKLTRKDKPNSDYFGLSVSISGDIIVVGAPYESPGGGSYVFERPDDGWTDMTQTVQLTASDVYYSDNLGWSISVSGNKIIVGAYSDDDLGEASGSAYFFQAKEEQVITFDELADKVYGSSSFDLAATASSGLDVTYASSNEAVATVNNNTITITGAGTSTITASQEGNELFYYEADDITQTLTVNKADLTITADNKEMAEGSSIPELTMSYAGFVLDDDEGDITVPGMSTEATSSSSVGTYDIVLDGGSADNYNLILVSGTLTISKALGLLTENAITVYPNPTVDVLTISDVSVSAVEIYDLKGALIHSESLESKVLTVKGLKEGIYLLKLLDKEGHILSTNRMIKK